MNTRVSLLTGLPLPLSLSLPPQPGSVFTAASVSAVSRSVSVSAGLKQKRSLVSGAPAGVAWPDTFLCYFNHADKKKKEVGSPSPLFALWGGNIFLWQATTPEYLLEDEQSLVGNLSYGPLKTSLFVCAVCTAEVKHKSNSSHTLRPRRPLGKRAKGEKLNYPPSVCLLCPPADPHSKTPGGLWTPTLGTTVLNGLSNCCISESHMATGITESTCSEAPAGDTF